MSKTIKAIQIFKSKTTNVGKNPLTSPDDFELVGIAPSQLPTLAGSGGKAINVSYDDTQTQLGASNVQQAIETLADDVYDYSGVETVVNGKKVTIDGIDYQVYRTSFDVNYQFIADSAQHFVKIFNKIGIRFHNSYIEVRTINNSVAVIPFMANTSNIFRILVSEASGLFQIAYITNNSNYNRYRGFIEYIKL